MTSPTYYAPGQWNFICDLCGGNFKSGTAEKTWDGFYVCLKHKERRNPQDFVRGIKAPTPLPWTRLPQGSPQGSPQVETFNLLQENRSAILLENTFNLLRT